MPTAPPRLPPHPHLFLTPERIASLRAQIAPGGDATSARFYAAVRTTADAFLPLPPLARVVTGRRLLDVSRQVLARVLHLGMVAVLEDSAPHALRAVAEMVSAAGFEDWNPAHYLDTAEMTLALAVGYDWLQDHLTNVSRCQVAEAILEKGLHTSLPPVAHNHWVDGTSNWTQVCHTGIAAGALAVAEYNPALSASLVARAVEKVPRAAGAYAPDGAYVEGPMYWGYGTAFHVMLIDLLTTAFGHEGGLADAPGFLASARYMLQATGPTGRYFNYSDSREEREFSVPMFWFARRLNDPALLRADLAQLAAGHEISDRLLPLALVWWRPEFATRPASADTDPPLHWRGRGEVPVGMHRSAWHDPRAAYVAIKGGCPAAPHGHMDSGAFVLEAGGVRWAADLGMQDYHSLESRGVNLWDGRPDGDRWRVFRVGGDSHSIVRFNGAPQVLRGRVPLVRFADTGDWPHTVVDLSAVYADQTARVWRGVALGANGQVILQDEWMAPADRPLEIRWQMLTHAEIGLSPDGRTITLRQDGMSYVLRVRSAGELRAEISDVSRPARPFDEPNPGATLLVLHTRTDPGQEGGLQCVGALAGTPAADAPLPPHRPLADWSAFDPALTAT